MRGRIWSSSLRIAMMGEGHSAPWWFAGTRNRKILRMLCCGGLMLDVSRDVVRLVTHDVGKYSIWRLWIYRVVPNSSCCVMTFKGPKIKCYYVAYCRTGCPICQQSDPEPFDYDGCATSPISGACFTKYNYRLQLVLGLQGPTQ
jgi:hypothetical protein